MRPVTRTLPYVTTSIAASPPWVIASTFSADLVPHLKRLIATLVSPPAVYYGSPSSIVMLPLLVEAADKLFHSGKKRRVMRRHSSFSSAISEQWEPVDDAHGLSPDDVCLYDLKGGHRFCCCSLHAFIAKSPCAKEWPSAVVLVESADDAVIDAEISYSVVAAQVNTWDDDLSVPEATRSTDNCQGAAGQETLSTRDLSTKSECPAEDLLTKESPTDMGGEGGKRLEHLAAFISSSLAMPKKARRSLEGVTAKAEEDAAQENKPSGEDGGAASFDGLAWDVLFLSLAPTWLQWLKRYPFLASHTMDACGLS